MPEMIDTSTMPGDTMDPGAIEAGAGKLRTVGSQVSTQGGTVLTSWQKISASYDAPEENTLFQAMNPVKTAAEKVGTDTGSAATALETFAEEVRAIKAAVAQIRQEAAAFKADVAGGVEVTSYNWKTGTSSYTQDWHEDQASVDKNNALISRTNDQQEALWKAERTCANAIRALVGLSPISAASESNPNGYGVDSIPDGTDMPWGAKVERTEGCGEGIAHGAVNGLSNFAGGVTSLFGLRNNGEGLWGWDWDWDWSWSNLGETWAGIGKFAIGAATTGLVTTPIVMTMPGPVGDFLRDSQKTFAGGVAGLVAIDIYADDPLHNWKEHGWRALGESGFNIATIVVPASKIGSLGKAGRVGEVALNITDPLYLATRAAQGLKVLAGPTVESLLRIERAVDLDTGLRVSTKIDIDVPAVNRDGVHTDLPNTSTPDVDAPPARGIDVDSGAGTRPEDGGPGTQPDDGAAPSDGSTQHGDTTTGGDRGGDYDPEAEGSTGGGTELSPGLAHRSFEDTTHAYGSETQVMDADTQPVDFGTTKPTDLGRIGEDLTRQDLYDRGYRIISEQAQIQMPNGKYFKPDFIAYDPTTNSVVLVESKMGAGAKFTPNQLVGYEHYAKGSDSLVGRSPNTQLELLRAFREANVSPSSVVSRVEVYRWNTEIVPSAGLRTRAGVS